MSPASLDLDALVDATPTSRDRVVDLMRAVSICVVVAWHWTFSITHWHDGRLVMPNPIADLPGLWAATWVLQLMPVFFFVGGYANLAGWHAVEQDGTGAAGFVRSRLARLTKPLLPWLACWSSSTSRCRPAEAAAWPRGVGSCSCRCGSSACTPW
jgi:Acyltransferase family